MENSIIVEVSCPTASIGIVDYPADKTWSVEITNMTEGENIITAIAKDQAGNTASVNAIIKYMIPETPENEELSISSVIMDINDTIILPINIANAINIQQVEFDLVYNPDVISILDITANDVLPSSTISWTLETGNAAIKLTSLENITVTTATALMDITFVSGDNAGTTVLQMQNVKLDNNSGSHTPDVITDGSITVCIKGDFNNNDRVDIGDAAKVAFMVTGKVPEDLRADFNGNGRVDIGDAAKISFYLAQKVSEL